MLLVRAQRPLPICTGEPISEICVLREMLNPCCASRRPNRTSYVVSITTVITCFCLTRISALQMIVLAHQHSRLHHLRREMLWIGIEVPQQPLKIRSPSLPE